MAGYPYDGTDELTPEWTFKIGTGATPTTLAAGTVAQLDIAHRCEIGRMGIGTCRLELYNDDGAFTPASIGGDGTWKDTDWYAQGVFVYYKADTALTDHTVFAGLVADVEVIDNGVNSRFVIEALDPLTVAGRALLALSTAPTGNPLVYYPDEVVDYIIGDSALFVNDRVNLPELGGGAHWLQARYKGQQVTEINMQEPDGSVAAASLMNSKVMPAGPLVAWHAETSWVSGGYTSYVNLIDRDLSRTDTTVLEFIEADGVTGDKLPFRSIKTGDDLDTLVNAAEVTCWYTSGSHNPQTSTATDATSIENYGRRNRKLSGSWAWQGLAGAENFAQGVADFHVNRFNTPTYTVRQLAITEQMVIANRRNTARGEWEMILDLDDALWRDATVTFTPTGAASQTTVDTVITGRRIAGTPGNVTVVLDMVDHDKHSSLRLGDTDRGVLGTHRVG